MTAPREQGGTLRAAQETAVRDVLERLTTIPGLQRQGLAGEVVDAVLAASRPQDAPDDHGVDHTTNPGRTAGSVAGQPLTRAAQLTDEEAEELKRRFLEAVGKPHRVTVLPGPTPDALDQAEARGYATAVAELRGVVQRTGSPAAQWAADYLEAVGPERAGPIIAYVHRAADGTETVLDPAEISIVRQAVGAGADETVRARGGVVQGAPPIEEIGPPGFVWPNVRVVDSLPEGRILFVSPRTDEDGSGIGRSGGEGEPGGSFDLYSLSLDLHPGPYGGVPEVVDGGLAEAQP